MEEYFYNEGHRLMQNDFIRQNQSRLNIIREERSEPWQRLETDGIFGVGTRDVVKEFQKKYCQPSNGRMDERTQRQILYIANQCIIHREQSTMRSSKPKVDLTVNSRQYNYYANPSTVCPMTACAKATSVASPSPVAESVAPETYEKSAWEEFKDYVEKQFYSIWADLKSILDCIKKATSASKLAGVLIDRLRALCPKLQAIVEKAKLFLGKLIDAGSKKIQAIMEKVKVKGKGYVKAINKNPSSVGNLTKVKSFAKNNAAGIILAAVPMVINLYKWITCDDSENAVCEKEFWSSFRSFLGALIVMIGIEVAAGALIAAGVCSAPILIVAAVIGLVVAIVDFIVMSVRDDHKGIADLIGDLIGYLFEGLEDVGKSLGDWVYEATHPDVPKSYTLEELELMGYDSNGLPKVS